MSLTAYVPTLNHLKVQIFLLGDEEQNIQTWGVVLKINKYKKDLHHSGNSENK